MKKFLLLSIPSVTILVAVCGLILWRASDVLGRVRIVAEECGTVSDETWGACAASIALRENDIRYCRVKHPANPFVDLCVKLFRAESK